MGQFLVNMPSFQRVMARTSLLLVFAGLSSGVSADGDRDCFSILEDNPALSATYPKRIAHGIHSLTLADLRYYFNPNANETNNIPTINRNLTSEPILNDAPDIGRSDRFKTIGLLVAEEVVLKEDSDWDIHGGDILDKLLHALHMHEVWSETSRLYKGLLDSPPDEPSICPCLADVENNGIFFNLRNIAMLIREPELAYNTENKRRPRGGRRYSGSYNIGSIKRPGQTIPQYQRRDADEEHQAIDHEDPEVADHSREYWVNLFSSFSDMTDDITSDLALFLFCMLN